LVRLSATRSSTTMSCGTSSSGCRMLTTVAALVSSCSVRRYRSIAGLACEPSRCMPRWRRGAGIGRVWVSTSPRQASVPRPSDGPCLRSRVLVVRRFRWTPRRGGLRSSALARHRKRRACLRSAAPLRPRRTRLGVTDQSQAML
jgi:hypothetical protein